MNRFKELGTIARRGVPSGWMGEARKAVAECKRLLEMRIRSAGKGRHQKEHLAGRCSKTLSDGTQVIAWINPFGLRPTVAVRVVRPEQDRPKYVYATVTQTVVTPSGAVLSGYPVVLFWGYGHDGVIRAQNVKVTEDWRQLDEKGDYFVNFGDAPVYGEPIAVFAAVDADGLPQPMHFEASAWGNAFDPEYPDYRVVHLAISTASKFEGGKHSLYKVTLPINYAVYPDPVIEPMPTVTRAQLHQRTIGPVEINGSGERYRDVSLENLPEGVQGWFIDFAEGEIAQNLFFLKGQSGTVSWGCPPPFALDQHGHIINDTDVWFGRANIDSVSVPNQRHTFSSPMIADAIVFATKQSGTVWLGQLHRDTGKPYVELRPDLPETTLGVPRTSGVVPFRHAKVAAERSPNTLYVIGEATSDLERITEFTFFGALRECGPFTAWPLDRRTQYYLDLYQDWLDRKDPQTPTVSIDEFFPQITCTGDT